MSDRTERFYQLLIKLQFKFLVLIFLCILLLQFGWLLIGFPYPISILGYALYYGVYVLGIFALDVFRTHKHIIDNIEVYVPKENPKPYSKYNIHLESDILTDNELAILQVWANGKSVKEMEIHPMILNRLLRKYVKATLKMKGEELYQIRK